jgi:hypothetical protein
MEVPSLLALNAGHRAIGDSLVGLSIQRYPNRKAPRPAVSDDLNATNGLAARPMPHGLKAFFAKRPVAQSDRFEFHHLKTNGKKATYRDVRGNPTIGRFAWLFHSVVPPSDVVSRARGAAISIGPNVPVSDRVRLPWRWPATPALASLPAIWLRP